MNRLCLASVFAVLPRILTRLSFLIIAVGAIPAVAQSSPANSGRSSRAQEQNIPAKPVPLKIWIASQAVIPGREVVVPLYHAPSKGTEVRSLSVEIEWVSKNLQFVRSERGISAEMIGAQVGAKIVGTHVDSTSLEHSTLRVDVSVEEDAPKSGIPDGMLAYLFFKVPPDAEPLTIELHPRVISAKRTASGNLEISDTTTEAGKVTIEASDLTPTISCFFFGH